ncbi:hypothetical protein HK096_007614, partial [Nowakowskiella sp. JEL0078]
IVVERAFGMLKGRFRVLLTLQIASPEFAQDVFFCCVVLHNLVNNQDSNLYLQEWDTWSEQQQVYEDDNISPVNNQTLTANEVMHGLGADALIMSQKHD